MNEPIDDVENWDLERIWAYLAEQGIDVEGIMAAGGFEGGREVPDTPDDGHWLYVAVDADEEPSQATQTAALQAGRLVSVRDRWVALRAERDVFFCVFRLDFFADVTPAITTVEHHPANLVVRGEFPPGRWPRDPHSPQSWIPLIEEVLAHIEAQRPLPAE